jgi:hypothetical protein
MEYRSYCSLSVHDTYGISSRNGMFDYLEKNNLNATMVSMRKFILPL